MYSACIDNKKDLVEMMLMHKYTKQDLNDGLLGACFSGNLELVKMMISKGADDIKLSISSKNIEITKYLISIGANDFDEGLKWACIDRNS